MTPELTTRRWWHLVHFNTHLLQVCTSDLDLGHEFLVSLWNIVEGHDIVAELAQEVCAEGDEGPEGKLNNVISILNL